MILAFMKIQAFPLTAMSLNNSYSVGIYGFESYDIMCEVENTHALWNIVLCICWLKQEKSHRIWKNLLCGNKALVYQLFPLVYLRSKFFKEYRG